MIHVSARLHLLASTGSAFTDSRCDSANRAAFQSLLQKLRPRSNLSLVILASGASDVPRGSNPIGRVRGSRHHRHLIRGILSSGFGTSLPQCGQTIFTGIRASCVSVAIVVSVK